LIDWVECFIYQQMWVKLVLLLLTQLGGASSPKRPHRPQFGFLVALQCGTSDTATRRSVPVESLSALATSVNCGFSSDLMASCCRRLEWDVSLRRTGSRF